MNFFPQPFYFLRHGETQWNRQNIAMGQTDIPLNETGLEQALRATKLLQEEPFTEIFVSPLLRARQTAKIVTDTIPRPISVLDTLKEFSGGPLEGKPKGDGTWIKDWRNGTPLEGVESFSSLKDRALKSLQIVFQAPSPVLIIAHGGIYFAIQEILNLPFSDLGNCIPIYHRPPSHLNHPWFVCPFIDERE